MFFILKQVIKKTLIDINLIINNRKCWYQSYNTPLFEFNCETPSIFSFHTYKVSDQFPWIVEAVPSMKCVECSSGPGPAWHCYYSLPDTPVLVSVHWRSWDTGIHSCQTPVLVSSEVILLSSDEGWEWHLLVMMVEWLLVTCWLALLVLTSVCNQCVVFERFILCQYHISWLSSNTKLRLGPESILILQLSYLMLDVAPWLCLD